MKKLLFLGAICLMAVATIGTIASCDKESDSTGTGGGGITPGGDITPAEYVDLGLPSGTKWKTTNETNPNDSYNFFTYDEAIEKFGSSLPTKEQLEELKDNCQWTWDDTKKGDKVVGPNGNSIFLPAAGYRNCDGDVYLVGSDGYYWSSTPYGSDFAWGLYFGSGGVGMDYSGRCGGRSVRLVQD